jgi:hypothetical protein
MSSSASLEAELRASSTSHRNAWQNSRYNSRRVTRRSCGPMGCPTNSQLSTQDRLSGTHRHLLDEGFSTRNRKVEGSNPSSGSKTPGQRVFLAWLPAQRQWAVIPLGWIIAPGRYWPASLRRSPPDRFIARRWASFVGPLRAEWRADDWAVPAGRARIRAQSQKTNLRLRRYSHISLHGSSLLRLSCAPWCALVAVPVTSPSAASRSRPVEYAGSRTLSDRTWEIGPAARTDSTCLSVARGVARSWSRGAGGGRRSSRPDRPPRVRLGRVRAPTGRGGR